MDEVTQKVLEFNEKAEVSLRLASAALGVSVQLDLWLLIYPWQVLSVSC